MSDTEDTLPIEKKEQETEEQKNQIDAEVLQNIPVTISVEVGRTSLKIRDLMRLAQGSVVELDRLKVQPLLCQPGYYDFISGLPLKGFLMSGKCSCVVVATKS